MHFTYLTTTVLFGLAAARPEYGQPKPGEWRPAGRKDLRGPCPMMNTLANHGFLPRNGGNITRENAVSALTGALSFSLPVANIMWEQAIIANPEPNATFFTLDHLNRHNVLEHDASLSRLDAYFGNNHVFNQKVFDTTKAYWIGKTLDAAMLANGKIARQLASRAFNPEYRFTAHVENFSLGELAAPIMMFGDIPAATVDRERVIYFFENERLPIELGWTKQKEEITLDIVLRMSQVIANATSLLTVDEGEAPAPHMKRIDSHFAFSA